jgi:hypothetical protein
MKLLVQRFISCDFDHQTAEPQARIAILNHFVAFGIPVIQPVG